jgi:prophage tail gpP-like protein
MNSIRLQVNGVEYTDFTAATVELRIDALSNLFSFSAASSGGKPLPFTGGESCVVIVNDQPMLTGYIEMVNGSYDHQSHTIDVRGRDKTCDIVDSTLDAISDIKPPITLKKVIQRIVKELGTSVSVIDNVSPEAFKTETDIQAPEPGDNAFEFLESLARTRQVLLTSDSDGNIVIDRASGTDHGAILQNVIGYDGNNILTAGYSYDHTGRFHFYKASSGANLLAAAFAKIAEPGEISAQKGDTTDTEARKGRNFVFVPEKDLPAADCNKRAIWESNIRKARSKTYSCVVQGFEFAPGKLWDINQLVTIVDEFANIDAKMLINSVAFSFSTDNGSTTTLSFVEENAYTLTIAEPKAQKAGSIFG